MNSLGFCIPFRLDTLNIDEQYYYVKNLQKDIIGILDKDGNCVVEYGYNPWGDITSITGSMKDTLGKLNPFRYRSYYYDNETGFYYLQSRYYDPTICRFINADAAEMLLLDEVNLFAYCSNNPVDDTDESGFLSVSSIIKWVKKLGKKALKVVTKIWSAFKKPGMINLKPFEIAADTILLLAFPSLYQSLKLVSYKAVNQGLVEAALQSSAKGIATFMKKFGFKLALNTITSTALNKTIYKNTSRFVTVGGLLCLLLDAVDRKIDYWFKWR